MSVAARVEVVSDWRAWRDLRLEALADTPIGFGELHADALLRPDVDWEAAMLRPGFRVMAYDGSGPVGMAGGFVRDTGVLDVHVDNRRAHAAYVKLGFVDTGNSTVGGGIDGRDLLEMARGR